MPCSRSLQPLLQFTVLRWASRPRSRHAFQIQRFLFNGSNKEEGDFAYVDTSWGLIKRNNLLRRLRFPRKYKPTFSKIWWTTKHTPRLLITTFTVIAHFGSWQRTPRPAGREKVKSHIGNFFYDLVSQTEFRTMLNKTIRPLGCLCCTRGASMRPTHTGNVDFGYHSYAYMDSRDISRGDVVIAPSPTYDTDGRVVVKRIAALGGDRILVDKGGNMAKEIIKVSILLSLRPRGGSLADT